MLFKSNNETNLETPKLAEFDSNKNNQDNKSKKSKLFKSSKSPDGNYEDKKAIIKFTIADLEEKLKSNINTIGKSEPLRVLLRRNNLKEIRKFTGSIDLKYVKRNALKSKIELVKKEETEDTIFKVSICHYKFIILNQYNRTLFRFLKTIRENYLIIY